MDYSSKNRTELLLICKEKGLTKYSTKTKKDLVELLNMNTITNTNTNTNIDIEVELENKVIEIETETDINKQKEDFVYQPMLTCLGNKRKLVTNIREIITQHVMIPLGKQKLNIVDGFAGSSVVSRELSYLADHLYTNDMELYAYLMAKCHLQTPTEDQKARIMGHINTMNQLSATGPYIEGIICKLYSPKVTADIQEGERCFYTRENALIIDTLRQYIDDAVEKDIYVYCLVPLLIKASINVNTAGVFKGFYKDGNIGCFGGSGRNALSRIMKPITLDAPIWNTTNDFQSHCFNLDINSLVNELPNDIDVIYLDPPYNQHPYGSNYFMLNIIAKKEEPIEISKVSGIPTDWNKSNYNKRDCAMVSMKSLIEIGLTKSRFLLLSYNNEGIIKLEDWDTLFAPYNVHKYEINYDTYKGCRNLKDRDNKVMEIMYLISLK